jgi:hypothetical protein
MNPQPFLRCFLLGLVLFCTGCGIGGWSPGIGDPTPMGWLTVVLYFWTSYVCFKCAHTEKMGPPRPFFQTVSSVYRVVRKHWPNPPRPARRAAIWLLISGLYFCLGVNKQLDLQSAITETGRIIARAGGWYDVRGYLQVGFIVAVILCSMISAFLLLAFVRREKDYFVIPLAGVIATLCFVLIRATSFHDMDVFIRQEILGIRTNWFFEIGGISLVIFGATLRLRAARC